MEEILGTGKVELYPLVDLSTDPELSPELDRKRMMRMQLWRCGGRPSDPDPLLQSLKAETNLHIYYPSKRFKDKLPETARALRKAAVVRAAKRLLLHSGFRNSLALNRAIQAKFGMPPLDIPWQKILAQSAGKYSIRLYSQVEYQAFSVSWSGMPVLEERYILSLPVRARHIGIWYEECDERGVHPLPKFWDALQDVKISTTAVPNTPLLKALSKLWLDRRISMWQHKLDTLREELDEAKSDREKLGD